MFEVVIMVSRCVLLLRFLRADSQMAEPLSRYSRLTGFLLPHAVSLPPFLEFLRWDLGRYFSGWGYWLSLSWLHRSYGSKLFAENW